MSRRREIAKIKTTASQQQQSSDTSEKRANIVSAKMGEFCLDVAKLIIGGVLLAGLMNQEIDYWPLALSGLIAVLTFVIGGIYLINKSNR